MSDLDERLGFDAEDPRHALAAALVESDAHLLEALVHARKVSGVSQSDLAERLGVTQPTVQAFECAGNDPKLSTIRRYASALNLLVTHKVGAFAPGGDLLSDDAVIGRVTFLGQTQAEVHILPSTWLKQVSHITVKESPRPQKMAMTLKKGSEFVNFDRSESDDKSAPVLGWDPLSDLSDA